MLLINAQIDNKKTGWQYKLILLNNAITINMSKLLFMAEPHLYFAIECDVFLINSSVSMGFKYIRQTANFGDIGINNFIS